MKKHKQTQGSHPHLALRILTVLLCAVTLALPISAATEAVTDTREALTALTLTDSDSPFESAELSASELLSLMIGGPLIEE